jgi:hypothetical protein
LTPELRDLIHRVAAHPHGLGFLHRASLESVATTLCVDAHVADQARQWMETSEGRARLIEALREARGETMPPPPPEPPEDLHLSRTIDELVERARGHPLGISFLMRAPLESVAVTLQAHPFLVLRAREQLHARARQGASGQDHAPERPDITEPKDDSV